MKGIPLRSQAEISDLRLHLDGLTHASWLGSSRQWWPRYLFHCTDILNIVSILQSGRLLSRIEAHGSGVLVTDIAAPSIISSTATDWQHYVRLYFRPRTPTQYRNEGFRPLSMQPLGSHCPIPVYLIFDALSVLSRSDCEFTDGNLAAGATPEHKIATLKQMPFQFIYHDSWFDQSNKSTIIYHRNAEVLIPQQLDLQPVRMILCRSQAEYQTLLHLLPISVRNRWANKIGVVPGLHLFHNKWSFVQQVDLSNSAILFRFNPNTVTPGPFDASVAITECPMSVKSQCYTWHNNQLHALEPLQLSLANIRNPNDYSISLLLDDHLAYEGRYEHDELPF